MWFESRCAVAFTGSDTRTNANAVTGTHTESGTDTITAPNACTTNHRVHRVRDRYRRLGRQSSVVRDG
jgi:hypothetical protein